MILENTNPATTRLTRPATDDAERQVVEFDRTVPEDADAGTVEARRARCEADVGEWLAAEYDEVEIHKDERNSTDDAPEVSA